MLTSLFQVTIDLNAKRGEITNFSDFDTTLEHFLQGLFLVAALLTFFFMLWGALDWILSQGESGKVEAARKKITGAAIGMAVLASVAALYLLVQGFLGYQIINPN